MPLISVIIPAYNAEKTIRETVTSVLTQTFSDFELIVINDGSQDSTLVHLASIPDPRLTVFSYPNAGAQRSRNRGIEHATGAYLAFLDADDLWTPDKLEAQYHALQVDPQAAVAYSWTNWIDETGNFLRRGSYSRATGNVFLQLLLSDFIENGSNPLIRREAIAQVGHFDESLVGGQDWDMWLRLAARFPFTVVPKPQILYRQSPSSWSTHVERQEAGFKKVIEKALAQLPDATPKLKRQIIANRYKCLTVDALQGKVDRRQGLIAARFLGVALRHDPSLLRAKVLLKVLVNIAAFVLLPPQPAQELLNKLGNLSNVEALHGYLQLEPS